jgi:hypothetical protein
MLSLTLKVKTFTNNGSTMLIANILICRVGFPHTTQHETFYTEGKAIPAVNETGKHFISIKKYPTLRGLTDTFMQTI